MALLSAAFSPVSYYDRDFTTLNFEQIPDITITFHGANNTENSISGGMGSKGMGVQQGGVVEIHGKQFHNSWSRIAASAAGGDDRVYLQV